MVYWDYLSKEIDSFAWMPVTLLGMSMALVVPTSASKRFLPSADYSHGKYPHRKSGLEDFTEPALNRFSITLPGPFH